MIGKAEFKRIFDTYFDTIRMFIFYRCGDTDMAQDLAQDVFMRVWEKRAHLTDDNLKALLYKMANDAAISNYRKDTVRQGFEQSMTLYGNQANSPEDETMDEDGYIIASSPVNTIAQLEAEQTFWQKAGSFVNNIPNCFVCRIK